MDVALVNEIGSRPNDSTMFQIFQTTRDTLMRVPGSFLYRLCQDDKRLPSVKVGGDLEYVLKKFMTSFEIYTVSTSIWILSKPNWTAFEQDWRF